MDQNDWNRLGTIVDIAERMQGREKRIGRTALMKFAYLLQTLKHVPLQYSFTLYSYGPFDSAVLDDLSYAGTLEAIKESMISFSSSYGYDIKPYVSAGQVKAKAAAFLKAHMNDIEWVIEEFGTCGAGQLELLSTIIYADQEALQKQSSASSASLVSTVHEIKPHFSVMEVEKGVRELCAKNLLKSVGSPDRVAA